MTAVADGVASAESASLADGLGALLPLPVRAVVINVATEMVSSLAVMSLRGTGIPILVVDCGATDHSRRIFARLSDHVELHRIEAPIRTHGLILDEYFEFSPDEVTLLVDSDAELREPHVVDRLLTEFEHPMVFGAGWTQGGQFLRSKEFGGDFALYHPRMWLPFVFLRNAHVRDALASGRSFLRTLVFNDFRWSETVSSLLARRFDTHAHIDALPFAVRLPRHIREGLRQSSLPWLRWARSDWYGHRPNYLFADTGALVHTFNLEQRFRHFAGTHVQLQRGEVAHYGGVTRAALRGNRNAARMDEIAGEVTERLKRVHGIRWDALSES